MVQGPIGPWYYDHKLARSCIWGRGRPHCLPVNLHRSARTHPEPRSITVLTQPASLRSEAFDALRRERAAGPGPLAGTGRATRRRRVRRPRPPSRRVVFGPVLALVVTAAVVAAGAGAAGRLPGQGGPAPASSGSAEARATRLAILQANHYRPFDAAPLVDAPVAAWSSLLDDPYTRLIPAADVDRREAAEAAGHVGIGVRLRAASDGTAEVAAVDDGSPAAQGGLRPGDEVLAVDGAEVAGLDVDAVADLIDGPEGSVLAVRVNRPGAAVAVTVQRGTLKQGTVGARLRRWETGLVGVITVPHLVPGAAAEVEAAISRLAGQGATAFVLDLRHNPGGPMAEAVGMASAFLPAGSVVASEAGGGRDAVIFATGQEPIEPAAPLVVLVDDLTSGTAEVVAGALSDHGRALVAGAITAGQSGLHARYPLPGGDALQTTYASYVTPQGRTIERHGIPPDVAAPTAPADVAHPPPPDGTGDAALDAALRAAASRAGGDGAGPGASGHLAPGPASGAGPGRS